MNINLSHLINKNEKIGVAVSGGSDSMALLYYLKSQQEKYSFTICAINIEHGIRGESSLNDTEFVKNYCIKNNIEYKLYSVKSLEKASKEGLSVEQSARMLRYECFNNAILEKFCDKVATAHHQSDNAETILFNLFRGSGLKGLKGIDEISGKIIRPFIYTPKQEILNYISSNNIPYINDETNFCCDYTRNYIRLKILPEIKNIFPEAERSITRFSVIAREEDEFLDFLVNKNIIKEKNTVKIILPLEKPLFARATIIALKFLGIKKDYEKLHTELIYSLISKDNGDKINLPKNIIAVKEYDYITLYKNNTKNSFEEIPFNLGEYVFANGILKITKTEKPDYKDGNFYIDKNKIPEGSYIRLRKTGDTFRSFGGKTKKLKEYLIDKKIPSRLRNDLPLIAKDSNILFVAGIEISDALKIDKDTINVLKLEYIIFQGEIINA